MEKQQEIIKTGYWIDENDKKNKISILKQNWDFYFEEGYDNELPDVNNNSESFYVIFGDHRDLRSANRSHTCYSEHESIELAKKNIHQKIYWEN